MINHPVDLRNFFLTLSTVTNLVGSRIYALRETPPQNYTLTDGAAIVYKPRGGLQDYSSVVHTVSYMFKFYDQSELDAWNLYRTFYDAVNDAHPAGSNIYQIRQETEGQPLIEPDVEWPFVLAFFEIKYRNC